MSISPYFLAVYWSARRESIEQCADRLQRFLSELSACDSVFPSWYDNDVRSKKSFQKRVEVESLGYLVDLLNRGRFHDDDKILIEDLGFLIGLSNGRDKEKQSTMSIQCGGYSELGGNSVVLNLPKELGDLRKPEPIAAVLASAARAWEPDSGGVMSYAAMKAKDYKVPVPFVDWMFYVRHKLAPQIPPLPPPARVQDVDGLGTIIVVQDEPPDHANPEHLRNIERVEAALKNRSSDLGSELE